MEQLGQYRIIRKLGAGTMGEVYLAEHVRMQVPYAVKILPESLAVDKGCRKRFVSEARVMATLKHPNIVQVHNMDVDGDTHYIVMDFVSPDGKRPASLDDLLKARGGKLSPGVVVRILEQVCEALIYSHENGVIHCDIKPANVLLDKNNVVRVSDFGLAKIMGSTFIQESIAGSIGAGETIAPKQRTASAGDSLGAQDTLGGSGSSRAESIVGTFHYMPPEVQTGGAWTRQGDVYSLGVLIYVLLTGELPLGRWKLPSQIVSKLPVSWDAVVEKSLENHPDLRYPSVCALLAGIRKSKVKHRYEEAPSSRDSSTKKQTPNIKKDLGKGSIHSQKNTAVRDTHRPPPPPLPKSSGGVSSVTNDTFVNRSEQKQNTGCLFAPFYWYYIVLKKYVVFKGRARRKEYWYFWLVNIILFLFSGLISGEDGGLMACYFIAVFLPSVAVSFRRLHDIGRSGWWFFILFIPWVGVVFYFIFMVLNSQQKTNVYGENPKALIAYKNAD